MRRLLVVLVLVVAACGTDHHRAPASVTAALSRVDQYVAAHDYASARLALDDLVRRTSAARQAGRLGGPQADRIAAAAAQLAAALPPPAPSPAPAQVAPLAHGKHGHGNGNGDGGDHGGGDGGD